MRPRAARGDTKPFEGLGAFETPPLADNPVVHRCVIYEKFYYPKWYTHHLKEKHIFLRNKCAILNQSISS